MHLKIPYFQTSRYRVQAMLDLAISGSQEKIADLGAGDGRIVIEFAKRGIESVGFEIDESLIKQAEANIREAGLEEKAKVVNRDFWQEDLSQFGIITIYGMPDVMEDLEKKLQAELKPGSRVVSNYYPFPTWKEVTKKDNVYLYVKGG